MGRAWVVIQSQQLVNRFIIVKQTWNDGALNRCLAQDMGHLLIDDIRVILPLYRQTARQHLNQQIPSWQWKTGCWLGNPALYIPCRQGSIKSPATGEISIYLFNSSFLGIQLLPCLQVLMVFHIVPFHVAAACWSMINSCSFNSPSSMLSSCPMSLCVCCVSQAELGSRSLPSNRSICRDFPLHVHGRGPGRSHRDGSGEPPLTHGQVSWWKISKIAGFSCCCGI